MWTDESVQSLDLEILDGFITMEGPEPDTWIIENLRMRLHLKLLRDGQVRSISGRPERSVFHIRRVSETENAYQIYRWWQAAE